MGCDDINYTTTTQHMVRRIRVLKLASVESSESLGNPAITSNHIL